MLALYKESDFSHTHTPFLHYPQDTLLLYPFAHLSRYHHIDMSDLNWCTYCDSAISSQSVCIARMDFICNHSKNNSHILLTLEFLVLL